MKHATPVALNEIEEILVALRSRSQLREKTRGVFYKKSMAFLHFHEDPKGLFADVKVGAGFKRLALNSPQQRQALLRWVDKILASN